MNEAAGWLVGEGEGGGWLCTSVHCRRSVEAALEEKQDCVCDGVGVGNGCRKREREDKGDRSKTPQSGRQTFDRGAL